MSVNMPFFSKVIYKSNAAPISVLKNFSLKIKIDFKIYMEDHSQNNSEK